MKKLFMEALKLGFVGAAVVSGMILTQWVLPEKPKVINVNHYIYMDGDVVKFRSEILKDGKSLKLPPGITGETDPNASL